MKISHLFLLIFCLSLSVQSFGQKAKKVNKITALKLTKKMAKKFSEGIKIQGFSVDKDGILRPNKDHEIIILDEKKQFVVKPIIMDFNANGNFTIVDLDGGGQMICACGFGAGDNCSVNILDSGRDRIYSCQGSCSCGGMTLGTIFEDATQFETADGNWNNF